MSIVAVRGAVSLEEGLDEGLRMIDAVGKLVVSLTEANGFSPDDVISIQLTQTSDLKNKNAATALREGVPAFSTVPLFCSLEPDVEGSLPRTVRILITWEGSGPAIPVYLGKAASLRPDLTGAE